MICSGIMKRGKFIVFEGGEGCGKSTLAEEMVRRFHTSYTREPGGTPFAEQLRHEVLQGEYSDSISPKAQFALMWSARADNVEHFIEPTLADGRHVICDRFDGSTFVYQIKAGDGDLHDLFFSTREIFLRGCKPDLYLVFDVPPETGMERVKDRKDTLTVFDKKNIEFHKSVRQGYLEFAALPEIPSQIIDASQPLEEVRKCTITAVEQCLRGDS